MEAKLQGTGTTGTVGHWHPSAVASSAFLTSTSYRIRLIADMVCQPRRPRLSQEQPAQVQER